MSEQRIAAYDQENNVSQQGGNMKNAVVAALVAALVAAGTGAAATTLINGRNIEPHSIPLNRLVGPLPAGQQGPAGPVGPQGPQGIQGPQGEQGASTAGGDVGAFQNLCVAPDKSASWYGSQPCPADDMTVEVEALVFP